MISSMGPQIEYGYRNLQGIYKVYAAEMEQPPLMHRQVFIASIKCEL